MVCKRHVGVGVRSVLQSTAAIVALVGYTASAHAEEETAETAAVQSDTQADEGSQSGRQVIVVTARRVEEDVQDIPISVGLLSSEDLVANDVADFQDLKGTVVGLTTSRTATTGGGYVTIRGLTPVATPQPASDQGVGFFRRWCCDPA